MKLKALLTKEYFKWLFFKTITSGLIIVSVYFVIIPRNQNIFLGIALFILSMFTYYQYYKIKPTPPLATCLDNSGMITSMYATTTMSAGLGFILLASFFGFEQFSLGVSITVAICLAIFGSGLGLYIYNCKKNGVIQ